MKKWSVELFSENYSYSYIKNGFQIKNVMISKRMVSPVQEIECLTQMVTGQGYPLEKGAGELLRSFVPS